MLKIPYDDASTNSKPMRGAVALSQILKDEYDLIHARDYTWYFDSAKKI